VSSETSPTCPQCGAHLPENAPGGLCPKCLMALNLKTETFFAGADVTAQPPLSPEQIAPHFPQLEILECLGRGGMGVVYKARQKVLKRLVALKLLAPERENDPKFAERFTNEAQALAALNHPNIVTIHDFGQAGGYYFLLMEFVDGANLRRVLQARKLAPEEALAIVPRICDALQYAHARGIVHRDIKPENILMDKEGRLKIADFGIAKMLGATHEAPESHAPERTTQSALGTPGYHAPEQKAEPQRTDTRADIYSTGVVFYEMLTGELPGKRIEPPSKKVHIDVRLDAVVMRALEKTPELRWQTAEELRTQLETLTTDLESSKLKRRNTKMKKSIVITILVVLCLTAVSLAAYCFWPGNSQQETQNGWNLWQQRKFSEAATMFNKAAKDDPKNAEAWNGLGWATFNSGNADDAEKDFQKVLSLNPDHPAALNGLGQIYLSQKRYDDAEKYLVQAAPKAPAAWYGLARLYLLKGQFDEAQKWAEQVVDSGQGDETAKAMLEAAKNKQLPEGLRAIIEPK
jgi:serine/threonine protein kinase